MGKYICVCSLSISISDNHTITSPLSVSRQGDMNPRRADPHGWSSNFLINKNMVIRGHLWFLDIFDTWQKNN